MYFFLIVFAVLSPFKLSLIDVWWVWYRDRPDISNLRSAAESRGSRSSFSNRGGGDGQQLQQQQPQQPQQQPPPVIQETEQNETVRRQPSVAGEEIKIVIHDVDFDPNTMGKSF